MGSESDVDLYAPFTTDILLEVRIGKMKNMEGLTIQSGIDKGLCTGTVMIKKGGLEGDEHDYTFHGGPDKAVHQYCASHYPTWQREHPSAASRFRPGGFGENLVAALMNERNVCVGDIVGIGDAAAGPLLEVSLPRQPCFKLNHRFRLKNFAPTVYRTSRSGWYYRVLRGGAVRAGDEIRLVERRHASWTVERVQEFLHRDTADAGANEALAALEPLGEESRAIFRKRVEKARRRAQRAAEGTQWPREAWREFRVVEKTMQTPRIVSVALEAAVPDPETDEPDPGAHVKIRLPNGLVRAYSLVDGDASKLQLGVALGEKSRGGSRYIHDGLKLGDNIQVGNITSSVPLVRAASNHVFIAGGVGITAFLTFVELYRKINTSVILHYAVRSWEDIPFRKRLDKLGDRVILYNKAKGERLDIAKIVRGMPWNSQLYFCGPQRLMDEALRETRAAGVNGNEVHFEAFEADISGDRFEVDIANRGRKLQVGEDESLLEVLRREFGDDVPSSCEVGNCGTCKVTLRSGEVEHRGTALTEEDKAGSMLSCVSRGMGRITIEV